MAGEHQRLVRVEVALLEHQLEPAAELLQARRRRSRRTDGTGQGGRRPRVALSAR